MREKQRDHPELILGPNPLLEALAPFIPMKGLPAALRNEPLVNIAWRNLPPDQRETLLTLADEHYWPISHQVSVASEIQLMLRAGLVQRNPMSQDEQRRINMLALADTADKVHLQSLRKRAGGSILSAITGLGKSTLVERMLSVFAPKQFVVHGSNKDCGWSVLTQVVYLIVNAPSNATRKGLFGAIIAALDKLLGTTYESDLKRQTIDQAMLFVARVLSMHRVGLLAIDENQASTLSENVWGSEFIQYFLGLMNLGIPVLLIGNPFAFSELAANAQLVRRFVTYGWHEFKPAAKNEDNSWWARQFLPGATRFTLCEEIPSIEEIQVVTSSIDGGIPGIFVAIWKEGQKIALRRGANTARLVANDLKIAASSPTVKKLVEIAKAASTWNADAKFVDLPQKPMAPTQTGTRKATSVDSEGADEALRRVAQQLRRQESRQKNKKERDNAARGNLTADDLRLGVDALAKLAGDQVDQGELDV